jgi:NTE family protein
MTNQNNKNTENNILRPGVALALSGGGFRATLFHLGAIWRLNQLGYLKKLNRITSVSGGSIINGVLAVKWKELNFDDKGVALNFEEKVASLVLRFCNKYIDIPIGLLGMLTWPTILLAPFYLNITPGELLAWYYDATLFKGSCLKDLPDDKDGPRFIFYSTNYQTGAGVRFSKPYVGDWKLGLLKDRNIKIATAVAASSAFPPVFAPLLLRTKPENWDPNVQAPLSKETGMRKRMYLADGGIYDNLGLEAASRYKTVLVSDAGAPFTTGYGWPFQLSHVKRISRVREIAMEQTRALRIRELIKDYKIGQNAPGNTLNHDGTYWGIATRINEYALEKEGLGKPLAYDNNVTNSMPLVSTRLWPFPLNVQEHLINWGYSLCDAAMRRYVLHNCSESGDFPMPNSPM